MIKKENNNSLERESMAGKYFNFSEVLGYGWNVMKANFWFFVGLGFVWLIINISPDIAELTLIPLLYLHKAPYIILYITLRVLLQVLELVIVIVLSIGLIKIALSFCD